MLLRCEGLARKGSTLRANFRLPIAESAIRICSLEMFPLSIFQTTILNDEMSQLGPATR